MEERNVKLSLKKAKEWYKQGGELKEVALQAYSEEELKDNRSHSWKEFVDKNRNKCIGYYISNGVTVYPGFCISYKHDRNIFPTKEYAEASLALAQLLQLRNEWLNGWEPNWTDNNYKWCIDIRKGCIEICVFQEVQQLLSFPTETMALEFIEDFRNLLEIAKPLL